MRLPIAIFILFIHASLSFASDKSWKSADLIFNNKTWDIASYTRVCEEYENDILVHQLDCRWMGVNINKVDHYNQGNNKPNYWEEVIVGLNWGDYDVPPVFKSIKTYASGIHNELVIRDESEITLDGMSSAAVREGMIINELLGDIFVYKPAPYNDSLEVIWNESCAVSSALCTLMKQKFADSFKTRPNPPCNKDSVACFESVDRETKSGTDVLKNSLMDSLEIRSEISYREVHKHMFDIKKTTERKVKTILLIKERK